MARFAVVLKPVLRPLVLAALILGSLCLTATSAADGATYDGDSSDVQRLQARFLNVLGLDDRPTPGSDQSASTDHMLRLYKHFDLTPGVVVRNIKLKSAPGDSCGRFSFTYDLSALAPKGALLMATVRLSNVFGPYDRPSLLLPSGVTSSPSRVHPMHRRLSHRRELTFKVTDDVRRCRDSGSERRRCHLVLEVTEWRMGPVAGGAFCGPLPDNFKANLIVVTSEGAPAPSPAAVQEEEEEDHPSRVTRAAPRPMRSPLCQRKRMYANFRGAGWDTWVIAPGGYAAYYCAGSCPFPMSDHLNTTNHAVIQTIANSIDPDNAGPTCCVPTEYAPINLLHYDKNGDVVLKQFDEMAVVACGCR